MVEYKRKFPKRAHIRSYFNSIKKKKNGIHRYCPVSYMHAQMIYLPCEMKLKQACLTAPCYTWRYKIKITPESSYMPKLHVKVYIFHEKTQFSERNISIWFPSII